MPTIFEEKIIEFHQRIMSGQIKANEKVRFFNIPDSTQDLIVEAIANAPNGFELEVEVIGEDHDLTFLAEAIADAPEDFKLNLANARVVHSEAISSFLKTLVLKKMPSNLSLDFGSNSECIGILDPLLNIIASDNTTDGLTINLFNCWDSSITRNDVIKVLQAVEYQNACKNKKINIDGIRGIKGYIFNYDLLDQYCGSDADMQAIYMRRSELLIEQAHAKLKQTYTGLAEVLSSKNVTKDVMQRIMFFSIHENKKSFPYDTQEEYPQPKLSNG